MSGDENKSSSTSLPANVDLTQLCHTLLSVLETRQCPTDTLPLLKPGDDFDLWHSQAKVHLPSVAAKERSRYICRHLSTEALCKASSFGVKFDDDVDSLLDSLRRVLATPKPPVDAYRQFSSRLQLPGESARDYLGRLRPLVLAAFPDSPSSTTDDLLFAHFRAGILDDHLRRKLIKRKSLPSTELLSLVQDYEDRYGPSLTSPCFAASFGQSSEARPSATRSVATQTYRNFTRPPRGRQASVAQISSESLPVPSVSSNTDFAAPIIDVLVADTRVTFLVDTGAACSLLNPKGFSRSWLRKAEVSHRRPRIVAANGMPLSFSSLIDVPLHLGASEFRHHFYVCADIQWQGILGADFLYAHGFCIDFATCQLTSTTTTVPFYFPNASVHQPGCESVCCTLPQPSDLERLVPDSPDYSGEQVAAVRDLIRRNSSVFAWDGEPLGRTNILQHSIDTGSARPFRQPPRRVPVHFQKQLEEAIKDMLAKRVIRPSSSPWASPIVLVKKKDGSLRLCVDYRKLNAVTVKDSFPLPRIDTTLEALAGAACFSTLDLQSGYWQVELAPEDRPKTAFVIPSGLYEFETMPFGLVNAPATFQRLMASVLRDLCPSACLVYLDDVIVHGSTVESHLANIQAIFDRLQAVGLKLNPSKCCFLKSSVPFLGHIVSTSGVKTDPAKTEQIQHWPQPTCVSDLRSFLGLASYYRRFIKDFARIATPLNRLMCKGAVFNWSKECADSFQELKRLLTSPPLLAFPNISDSAPPFILDTDASDAAIGAVLSQQQADGLEHPLLFASQSLSSTERNYSTTRKELLAVVTFVKKFHHYLAGKPFIIRTDHQALRWLENFKDPTGQYARWQADLSEYSYKVLHRAGKKHQNADALSRRARTPSPPDVPVAAIAIGNSNRSQWASAQATDPYISLIYERLRIGASKPSSEEMRGSSWETRCLWSAWNSLRLCDDVLYLQYSDTDPRRLVLPHDTINPILSRLHSDLGHAGQARTDVAARQRFWCPNQRRIIQDICNTCPVCMEVKNPNPSYRAPLQPIQAGYPNEIVGVDLMGPMSPTERGNRYILVLVDFFTKWCEAVPIPKADADVVASAILNEWICRHGVPEQLHSDQGAQFESRLMEELCDLLHIRKSRSTPWHPQGNGQVERTNRTLKVLIQSFLNNSPRQTWDVALPQCLLAYRSATHSSTGHTPFALMYGREVRLPLDSSCPLPLPLRARPNDFVRKLRDTLHHAHELARTCLATAHQRQKDYYDRRAHGAPYQPGDKVFWYQDRLPSGSNDKFASHWIGPFDVVEVPSEALCMLRTSDDPNGPTFAAHFNKLRPYDSDDTPGRFIATDLPVFPPSESSIPSIDHSPLASLPVVTPPPMPSSPSDPLPELPDPSSLIASSSLPVSRTVEIPRDVGPGIPRDAALSE